MGGYITCEKCGQQTMLQCERVDHCQNPDCGWYNYYPDAYAPGDTYKEGYDPVERQDD